MRPRVLRLTGVVVFVVFPRSIESFRRLKGFRLLVGGRKAGVFLYDMCLATCFFLVSDSVRMLLLLDLEIIQE